MDKKKRITLNDLLARKEQADKDKMELKYLYCEGLGGEIQVVRLPMRRILEYMDEVGEQTKMVESMEWNIQLIYAHCPIFKDRQLQEVYECKEPDEIIEKVFNGNISAIGTFAQKILTLYGFEDEESAPEIEVKN